MRGKLAATSGRRKGVAFLLSGERNVGGR